MSTETKRKKYFQDLIATFGEVRDNLARNPQTPPEILEALFKRGGQKANFVKNPSTPEAVLRRIADERNDYFWRELAKNPSTSVDLLFRFINEKLETQVKSNELIFDLVIANPNFPVVERNRLMLEKAIVQYRLLIEETETTAKANTLMTHRRNNLYALTQRIAQNRG